MGIYRGGMFIHVSKRESYKIGGRTRQKTTHGRPKVAAYSTRDETVVEMRVLGERLLAGYDTKKETMWT